MSPIEKACHTVENAYQTVKTKIDEAYDAVGKFLDENPTIYKIVLIACHFFRAVAMFALMEWIPLPMPVTVAGMVGGTLLYRAAVERFCCFRFAIPSMAGGAAAWLAKAGAINCISGAALSSVGLAIANALLFLPLLGYTAWVIYLSHEDIEKRMETLGQEKPGLAMQNDSCCQIPAAPVKSCCADM